MKCWGPYGPWWLLGDRIKSVRGRGERERQSDCVSERGERETERIRQTN